METFLIFTIASIIGYALCVWYLISLSTESHISKATIHTRIFAQYACSTLLIFAIASALLHFQAAGAHLMSTWNDSSFTTDLMVLVFLASILIAYNIRFIRIFCQPVYLVGSIPNLDQFILYLRPFETDNTSFEGFVKYISDKSYKAIAIANPHMVVQNVESDKIYATDEEWKDAVHQCMQKSKFNILHIGNTDGCLWELQQCMDNQLGKTIFIVSTEEGYSVLQNFIYKLDKHVYFPKLPQDGSIAFFHRTADTMSAWDNFVIYNRQSAEELVDKFVSKRQNLLTEFELREEARKKPLVGLFQNQYFPEKLGMYSWAWLSVLAFPFVGRLRTIYTTILLVLTLIAILSRMVIGPWILWGIGFFIALFGKRMMWLSGKWAGGEAISKQINFLAIIQLISLVLAYFLSKWYLYLHPIQHSFNFAY